MAAKKSTDVMIAGKVYTLSGYEEEGYLQRVASYINTKISEITERDEFRRIPNDMKSILIQLNIADDYFKARSQYENAEENYKKAEKDLFELKHELVDTQMKVEELLEKLDRERREHSRKSDREQNLEESYQKLSDKYQLLLNNAKVSDEKNRQFEEMLHLTQQEKRELEAVNRELRLNKEKLESTLADALLGAAKQDEKEAASSDLNAAVPVSEDDESYLAPAQLSKEEVNELRNAVNTTMAELSAEKADASVKETELSEKETDETKETKETKETEKEADQEIEKETDEAKETTDPDIIEEADKREKKGQAEKSDEIYDDSAAIEADVSEETLFSADEPALTLKEASPVRAELSEEELAELLAPVAEPVSDMPELSPNHPSELSANLSANLSKEELEELLAPADPKVSSVITEISEEDDPELQEIARQIAELERQEQAEKQKKKDKKRQKRKH